MSTNIWKKLKKPIYILAPMEDVTDTVFRQVIMNIGRPDLLFTEFTSCEGIAATKGLDVVTHRFEYINDEKPIIAQIWGKSPEAYRYGADLARKKGFDGIDINMGCPVRKIIKQGCCGALINNPTLAKEIINATKDGANELPVSVKTRIGFDTVITEEWFTFLLEQDLDAITVHGRTVAQQSKVANNWEEISKVVQLKENISEETIIIGNGDILSLEEAEQIVEEYKLDGVMIGRGVFQNPWVFNRDINPEEISPKMRYDLLSSHLDLFNEKWGERKNFNIMKKFFKMYIRGFDGAAEVRESLMRSKDYEEASLMIKNLSRNSE